MRKRTLMAIILIAIVICSSSVNALPGNQFYEITPSSVDPGGGGGGASRGYIYFSDDTEVAKVGVIGHVGIRIDGGLIVESHPRYRYTINRTTVTEFISRYNNVAYGKPRTATLSQVSNAGLKAGSYAGYNNGWYVSAARKSNPSTQETNCAGFVWFAYRYGANYTMGSTGDSFMPIAPFAIFDYSDVYQVKGYVDFK